MGFVRVRGAWGGFDCRPLNQPPPNPVPAWVRAGKAETSALPWSLCCWAGTGGRWRMPCEWLIWRLPLEDAVVRLLLDRGV